MKATTITAPWEWVMRAARAVEKVQEKLLRTARALEEAQIPYAVIGGNAVAIWVSSVDEGAARNTKDVDILLARDDLDRAVAAMDKAGFDLQEVHGVTVFLDRFDPDLSRGVDVVFVGEVIRPHYKYPAPEITNTFKNDQGVRALGLYELLIMKLQSYRRIDQVHVIDLLNVGLIDNALADQLPKDLRERLDEIRANPDG